MQWPEVRKRYPHEWLLVEALEARSAAGKRLIDQLAVVEAFTDSPAARQEYVKRHHEAPNREFYVVHTDRKSLDIAESR